MRTKWELRAEGESSDKINSIWGVLSATEKSRLFKPPKQQEGKMQGGKKCRKNIGRVLLSATVSVSGLLRSAFPNST